MTRNKDLKRLVRARMTRTGESYTAARAQVVKKSGDLAGPATPAPGYAALAGMADEKVLAKTGRTWAQWVAVLDGHGAASMKHADIARMIGERYDTPDWWTQTVTVGYERIKGLRGIGQRMDGTYEASKSRTFGVPVGKLFDACAKPASRRKWLGDAALKVRTSNRPKSIRLRHDDGSVVILGFLSKGRTKSSVAVQHTKLPSRDAVAQRKEYWEVRLAALGKLLDR